MRIETDAIINTPGQVLEGDRVAILDPQAIEEGRLAAHERSHLGALSHEPGDVELDQPVTLAMVAVRRAVLEDARATALDDLAVLQGKIIGLREILEANGPSL